MRWWLLSVTLLAASATAAEPGATTPTLVVLTSEGVEIPMPPAFDLGEGEPEPCGPERRDHRVVVGRRGRRASRSVEDSVGLGRVRDGKLAIVWCMGDHPWVRPIEPTCAWQHPAGEACTEPQAYRHAVFSRWLGGRFRAVGVHEVLPPGESRSRLFPEGVLCRPQRLATVEGGRGTWDGPGTTPGRFAKSALNPIADGDTWMDSTGEVGVWSSAGAVCQHEGGRWASSRSVGGVIGSPDEVSTTVALLPDGASHVVLCRDGEVLHDVLVPDPAPSEALPGTDGLGWMDVFTWTDRRGRTWHQAVYEPVVSVRDCARANAGDP